MLRFTWIRAFCGMTLAALVLAIPAISRAQQDVTLTFDALRDLEFVGNYYAGGYGSLGTGPGPDYGIYFSPTAEVIKSKFSLGGGNGNFLNEPSPTNIVFFGSGGGLALNAPNGFRNGLSLYYTGPLAGSLAIYSEVNSGGNLLATIALPALGSVIPGVNDTFALVCASFPGVAKSVNFGGAFDFIGFDNITLGLITHCSGSIALSGVSDLSAISPLAPLGTFHVSFRQPGSVSEIYGADVTLATTPGSAYGTFAVDVISGGTYDVWIKGAKNLAVVLPSVTVSGATYNLGSVTLPGGDANDDNSIDATDFGLVVSAYNSDAAISDSGYDPLCDFNFDGMVNATDFSLFVGDYNAVGAP